MTGANESEALTASQTDRILRGNDANLVKKVQTGRTLSAGKVNLLQGIQMGGRPEPSAFAGTQVQLADFRPVDLPAAFLGIP